MWSNHRAGKPLALGPGPGPGTKKINVPQHAHMHRSLSQDPLPTGVPARAPQRALCGCMGVCCTRVRVCVGLCTNKHGNANPTGANGKGAELWGCFPAGCSRFTFNTHIYCCLLSGAVANGLQFPVPCSTLPASPPCTP